MKTVPFRKGHSLIWMLHQEATNSALWCCSKIQNAALVELVKERKRKAQQKQTHRDTHCGTIKKMIPSEPALAFCHNFLYFYYLLAILAVA